MKADQKIIVTGQQARQILNEILEHDGYMYKQGYVGYFQAGDSYVAFDNTTADCWVEEFESKEDAVQWINEA